MPTGIPIADGIGAAIGLGQSVVGLINAEKTKHEAEILANSRPKYNISPLVGEDLSLAESDLSNGMSSAATKAYEDSNNQQFSSSIGAILRNGGPVNNIGDLYGNNQDGRLKLSMMKDNLRLQQIKNLSDARQRMEQEQQTQWQVNDYAPWADKSQANAAARNGAQKQINDGLNTFGSSVMSAANTIQENNTLNPNTRITSNIPNTTYSLPNPTVSNPQYNSQYTLTPHTESYGFTP